ncbi:hypothetical protein [Mesorhizobium sp. 10J20-29]
MDDADQRKIARSTVARLLELLPGVGANYGSRDFDAELFKLIDAREVRKATVVSCDTVLRDLPPDAGDLQNAIRAMSPTAYEDWVSETRELTLDSFDASADTFEAGRCGYLDAEGQFVELPILQLVPRFTTSVSGALMFKTRVFRAALNLTIVEGEGKWAPNYRVWLKDRRGKVIHMYSSDELPYAILGCVLGAMLADWANETISFTVVEG